jgi:hypothetical protein
VHAPSDGAADGLSEEEGEVVARYPDLFPPGTPPEQVREQIAAVLAAEREEP